MGTIRYFIAICFLLIAPAAMAAAEASLPALGTDLDGVWGGSFGESGMDLNIAFAIQTQGGKSSVLLRIPESSSDGIPASAATRNGPQVRFEVKDIAGEFEGAVNGEQTAIQGTWVQMGRRVPLTLKRREH